MKHGIRFLHIYPTMKCPLNCAYCYVDDVNKQKEELPLSFYEKLIKEVKEFGLELVDIAGGEPLVYPDIIPLIEMITGAGHKVRLVSNGLYLDRFMMKIKNMNQIDLHISLDSPNEEIQDKVRSYKGLYKKVSDNIIEMQKRFGPCITVNIVINRTNYKTMKEMLLYLHHLGVRKVDFQPVMSVSKKTSTNLYTISTEELLETYQSIQEFNLQNPDKIKINLAIPAYLYPMIQKRELFQYISSVSCTFVYGRLTGEPYSNSLYVKSDGDAYLSATMINNSEWSLGNVRNIALDVIWSENAAKIRTCINEMRKIYAEDAFCECCCAKHYCSMADLTFLFPYLTGSTCSLMRDINELYHK